MKADKRKPNTTSVRFDLETLIHGQVLVIKSALHVRGSREILLPEVYAEVVKKGVQQMNKELKIPKAA